MASIKLEIEPMPVQRHVRVKLRGRENAVRIPLGDLQESELQEIVASFEAALLVEWKRQQGGDDA